MTHVELIEKIRDDYIKEFTSEPAKEEDTKNFRQGMIFAYNYLLTILKNDDSWIYEGEKENE